METITSSLLSDHLVKALGDTLIQSLWQGLVLALAGGLIIVFTKKLTSALRYNLLIAALFLFTGAMLFTFIQQLQPLQKGNAVYNGGNAMVNMPGSLQVTTAVSIIDKQNVASLLTGYLNDNYSTIVLIWFLIICAKSVKLAVGIREVYCLKHSKINAVSSYWENRLQQLSASLKIRQVIRMVESGLAKTPMVIGHLKPLILIPVGFINALSTDEVEAILVHELAHIRRRDYLVNLLQSLLEIIFFFNPAVMWISQLIKAERENCCDDIALKQAGSKSGYIQALLSCQEYQLAAPGLSMALARDKSKLLNRVKRMVNNHNQSLNIMEKTVLTIGMVTAGLLTVAFSAKNKIEVNPVKRTTVVNSRINYQNTAISQIDTTVSLKGRLYNPADYEDGTTLRTVDSRNGKTQAVYLFKRKGILYQVFTEQGKPTSLYVNRQAASLAENKDKINGLLKEFRAVAAVAPAPPAPPARPAAHERAAAVTAMTPPAPPVPPAREMAERSENDMPAPPVPPARPAPVGALNALPPTPPVAPLPPIKPASFTKITDELIKAGVIKDKDNFDINISNETLEVDGVTQPEALHQQVLKKFVKKPGDKVNWHYSNHN